MMITRQARQGDLLFIRHASLPATAKKCAGRDTFAYGEVSTHAHRLASLDNASIYEDESNIWAVVESPTEAVHEEHNPGLGRDVFSVGVFESRRQVEYDPDAVARQRQVQD